MQDHTFGDIEKAEDVKYAYTVEEVSVPAEDCAAGDPVRNRVQRFADALNIEQRGIERVLEDERTDKNLFKIGTLWLSANMVVSSFAIGVLATPIFHLGFVDAFLAILFFNLLAILPVCFFSTFGPKFGLRQMVLSRFWFGSYTVKVVALFNLLACIGWSSVNVMVGSQMINTVNPNVPGYAGIIIIAACTFLVTLFGYKVVHSYETYSWIPCFVVFLVVLGEFARSGDFVDIPMQVGVSEASSILSFAAALVGFAVGWSSLAADYTCYQPSSVNRGKVFAWTFVGLIVPLIFTETLGLAVATAIDLKDDHNPYTIGWGKSGVGGLLGVVLDVGSGTARGYFGSFCLIILALSTIANNCPNIYSLGFSLQLMAKSTAKVPRFIWTFIGTVAYCAIAIPGYADFAHYLENFMLFIGYWLAIYVGISLTEHFVYKRSMANYKIEHWDNPSKLPPGIAAFAAFLCGILGAVMGMSQVEWFVGPIARLIGNPKYGGDVGFELAFGFSVVSFLIFRSIEKAIFHR